MEVVITPAAPNRTCCLADAPSTSTSAPQPDSSDGAHGSQQNETADEIFLSHSGRQKGFVERLYNALVKAGHSPFFDRESVPRAVLLSAFIKRSTRESKLGVVVLSRDFVTTKWPMMELEIMIDSSVRILPLFYELSLDELKDSENLTEWRREWEKIAANDKSVDVSKWEDAVKFLDSWSGMVFTPKTSEALYIQNIVLAINKIICPLIKYDLSDIKGKSRLIEEMEARFNIAQSNVAQSRSDACAVGLHGVGGLGKTTLCKVMVNHYKAQYPGKSELMEFPSKSDEKSKILEVCKKILQYFTSIDDTLLEQVDDFDTAVELMKKHMKSHKVFMAIDNVWDHSLEEVKRILEVGFTPGSRLLLTSRSELLLRELLNDFDKTDVGCVPSMDGREALEMVETSFGKPLSPLVSEDLLERLVELCLLNGEYHPLALKAMGQRLKRMQGWGDVEAMHDRLSSMKFSSQLSRIEGVIKGNFECIPSIRQRMFVDVAILPVSGYANLVDRLQEEPQFIFHKVLDDQDNTSEIERGLDDQNVTLEIERDLLRILYEGECSSHYEVDEFVRQLGFDGLLQFGSGGKVEIHDLYLDLARREAVSTSTFPSPRFYLGGSTNMEAAEWAKLKRIVVRREAERSEELGDRPKFELGKCPKVEVLIAENVHFSNTLRLRSMESLRVLIMRVRVRQKGIPNLLGLEHVKKLAVLELTVLGRGRHNLSAWNNRWFRRCREAIGALTQLQTLIINGGVGSIDDEELRWNLEGCRSLKILQLSRCGVLDADCLPSLTNLRCLSLKRCMKTWTQFPDLTGLSQMQSLFVQRCPVEAIGRRLPSNLLTLTLNRFPHLKRLPAHLSALTKLRELWIGSFKTLERFPDMRTLAHLETLSIAFFSSQQEDLRDFPPNLQNLNIRSLEGLKRLDMHTLIRLRVLRIVDCDSLEDIGDLPPGIVDLTLLRCPHLDVPTSSILTHT